MQPLRRTRHRPGPLLLITLAWLALTGSILRAHDPGLSSLDVRVSDGGISAQLSIAAPDMALMAPGGEAGARLKLGEVARDAVRVSVDGEVLRPVVDEVSVEEGAGRVRLSFAVARSRREVLRLAIASDLPRRVARGHRQLMVVSMGDRVVTERLLDAESGPVAIDLEAPSPSAVRAAWHFIALGVRHILSGYDHLVFLAGLLLASWTVRGLVGSLTAFTAAHSVTLALVAIGGVHAPASIVEPLIAASIAWVGLENLLRRRNGARWPVVFGFGLIHGFGFAEALMDLRVGSSASEIALSLLSFNAGVEVGQLAAAAAMMPLVWMIKARPQWQARLVPICSMMIVRWRGDIG